MDVFAIGLSMGESPRWRDGRLWVATEWGGVGSVGGRSGRLLAHPAPAPMLAIHSGGKHC